MKSRTRTIAATGTLCALAYAAAAAGRVPLVLFLKYDPKDIVIAVGGFAFGPSASFATPTASTSPSAKPACGASL